MYSYSALGPSPVGLWNVCGTARNALLRGYMSVSFGLHAPLGAHETGSHF